MKCPYCNFEETKVNDSRESKDNKTIRRRRECMKCFKRFNTIEKVLKLELDVLKVNGEIEEFNLSKIKRSLLKACEKRPITLEEIDNLLDKISDDIKKLKKSPIETSKIGKIVLKNLKDLDEMSFLKFAIVHNNYDTIDEFKKKLSILSKK